MASLHWACQFAGIVVTPLNWRIKREELDYCLNDAEAAAIVFDDVAADAVAGAAAAQRLPRIAIGKVDGATCRFEDLQGGPNGFGPRAGPEDLSLLLYTSGTTGRPKGVPRRHRAERAAALATCRAEPVRPCRAHARRHAPLPHDGRALVAGDDARRRDLRLPAALRRGEGRCG